MAPNLAVRGAYVRGDYDIPNLVCSEKLIRTDFVLQNIYAHVIENVTYFRAANAINSDEKDIIIVIKEIVDFFKENYGHTIRILCEDLTLSKETLEKSLQGVANELFCEGITWSRIVALFVFVGAYAKKCFTEVSQDTIDNVYECFCSVVKEKLCGWVEDHGGWDGIRTLSKLQDDSNDQYSDGCQTPTKTKGWAKSILYGTVRMIGTIAHIANTTGQVP